MRRFARTAATVVVTALAVFGAQAAYSAVHEESRNFNCAKYGNHTCGTTVDWTPNNGERGTQRVNLVFDKTGTKIIRAYTWGPRSK